MRGVERVHAVLLQHFHRGRVELGELGLEVEEQVGGLAKVVAPARAVERHDRYALHDGGVELEEAPRALEDLARLEEHEHARVFDVREQLAEILRGDSRYTVCVSPIWCIS